MDKICEFCKELAGEEKTYFNDIYKGVLNSRITRLSPEFSVVPTIGQLLSGWLMLITNEHCDNFASLSLEKQVIAMKQIHKLQDILFSDTPTVIFEHGVEACSGRGCGIYHAHVHIVPLPNLIKVEQLVHNQKGDEYKSPIEAWQNASNCSEYLMVTDSYNKTTLFENVTDDRLFPSQFCRMRIVDLFGLPKPWDWRKYGKEEAVLKFANELEIHKASIQDCIKGQV